MKKIPINEIWNLSFEDKIAYLDEYKEFLYEIWYQKLQNVMPPQKKDVNKSSIRSLYLTFACWAKNILRPDFDWHMDEVVAYQKSIEDEIESFRFDEQKLAEHCKSHSYAMQNKVHSLLNNKEVRDKYLKSRLADYRDMYISSLVNHNRYSGIKFGYKSEALLLIEYSHTYSNIEETNAAIWAWFGEIEEMLNPVREFKTILFKQHLEENGDDHHPKYYYLFEKALKTDPSLEPFREKFFEISEKINFWSKMYEAPCFVYRKHYTQFRQAIATHLEVYRASNYIPQSLFPMLEKYVDNRFEKLEAYKQTSSPTLDAVVIEAKENYSTYLQAQIEELKGLPSEAITQRFRDDIIKMLDIKAKYLCPEDQYEKTFSALQKSVDTILPTDSKDIDITKFYRQRIPPKQNDVSSRAI